ncbi:hypothetical protein V2J59_24565 [Pseudomonas alliivorans]|uniref:Uncharacterized protein n=1 Tax=Pseudomonas alliivorans TaxID=2810613 RepID=A0ABS4CD94_9PSED|nr:hypothetical protein [Pseudomonas alliivorans]MBP0948420.1 hypothetical protein [Pseudomonas alliivorans]MEE4328799.1 hypothetical protein [Pseudomonas alliivorans]MEE4370400.1 hypothetical protein [Pseudomonas alliivorans]
MQLDRVVQSISSPLVVVDDSLMPPDFKSLTSSALTALFSLVEEDGDKLALLATLLGLESSVEPGEAVEVAENKAAELWKFFVLEEHTELLSPLFADFASEYNNKRYRVDSLIRILTELFGVAPDTYPSLEDARKALSSCAIAFVDYYASAEIDNDTAANNLHVEYKDALCSKFNYDGADWPKVVFLISHALPSTSGLADFRQLTGIKSAFFIPLDKKYIEPRYIQRLIWGCIDQYPVSVQLSRYLDTVHNAINFASKTISNEIERLELHDLVALKSLRLDAESESVQSYLTWLVAEALAAKVRSAPELKASLIPNQNSYIPIDGKLLPQSVLFELYSEIAAAPIADDASDSLVMGDVFELVSEANKSRELRLVIAPACDLMRCSLDYDVVCVGGTLLDTSSELSELLGKSYSFGKGQLVLKHIVDGQVVYSKLSWDKKKLCTIKRRDFNIKTSYVRLARLSEVFASEVKELALSHLARVGTPIDPSFSVALKALVRCKIKLSKDVVVEFLYDLSDKDFVSAILSMGREASTGDEDTEAAPLQETILFSAQFHSWILDILQEEGEKLPVGADRGKFDKILNFFGDPKNLKVISGKNLESGAIKIKYLVSDISIPDVCSGFEVWLTPYTSA